VVLKIDTSFQNVSILLTFSLSVVSSMPPMKIQTHPCGFTEASGGSERPVKPMLKSRLKRLSVFDH